jgi:hypothetical protein
MNRLAPMVDIVKTHLLALGHNTRNSGYINGSRNYYIQTDKKEYILKWNETPFMRPEYRVPELRGQGPCMSLSLPVYKQYKEQGLKPIVLFGTAENDTIHAIDFDEMGRLSYEHQQFGGEWVLLIPVKKLSIWKQ